VTALIEHRRMRERQIVDSLADGPRAITSIVEELYADIDPKLHQAAGASVYAHLLALSRSGRVESLAAGDESDWKADWRLA
jgi:Fe2+ or Zn2+ uptake regulation protein